MKKILVAILLIIPLIVLLTINVSGMIISAEISINIESMTLTHRGQEVFAEHILLEEYTETNKRYQLFANYFPRIAQNKSIIWTTSDDTIATVHNGVVTFIDYGSVDITATAASNTSCSVTCTFYVVGEKISEIKVSEYDSDITSTNFALKKYEKRQLNAEIIPVTALGNSKIEWSSSNKEIVKVDNNGVLTAKNTGIAKITIKAKGIKGEEVTKVIDIIVEGEMLAVTDTVYTSSGSFDFANVITSSDVQVFVNNKLITNKIYDIGNNDSVDIELRKDGVIQVMRLERKATDKALVIDNLFALQKGVWSKDYYLALGSANIVLEASAAEGELPDGSEIIWSSNDINVIGIVNGRLHAYNAGTATITASYEGYESANIELTVAMPINYIRLEYNEREDKVGLAEDRVFGIYTYKNGDLTNQLKMNISSTSPNVLDIEDYEFLFQYSSSNENYATVDEGGIIRFSRDAIGKKVTITVEARFSPLYAKASYTFKVVDGINVGMGYNSNRYDKDNDIMPSFEPFYDLQYIANTYRDDLEQNGEVSAIVFHTNIYHSISTSENRINLSRSIYGNGYKLDGQFQSTNFTSRMFGSSIDGLYNPKRPLQIVIENLAIQSHAPISDDAETAFTELSEKGGMPYYKSSAQHEGITHIFRFCLFQYAFSHMEISAGTTIIEGCIFRNTAGPAILMQTSKERAADITIKNCIFSNSLAPAIISTCGEFLSKKSERDGTKYPIFRLEGESYIYNWKNVNELELKIIPDDLSPLNTLNDILDVWIKDAINQPGKKKFVYNTLKGDNVNFGFIMIPLWVPNNALLNPSEEHLYNNGISIIADPNKYMLEEFSIDTSGISLISSLLKSYDIRLTDCPISLILPKGAKDGYNTLPDETYELNAVTIAKLHGRT